MPNGVVTTMSAGTSSSLTTRTETLAVRPTHWDFTVEVTSTSGSGSTVRSLTCTSRNETSSPLPWFCSPMKPDDRSRDGSVEVKSLISVPLRNTRIR